MYISIRTSFPGAKYGQIFFVLIPEENVWFPESKGNEIPISLEGRPQVKSFSQRITWIKTLLSLE
jgi:hypothetical protein